ncbi:MAG: cytochrome c nitrite reductase small subunit [Ectothiorhodospiraceae bacterium]|nr:cytochrome c nitrite reductase small subunit [Ectothiorhodospiraceae bacterium]
MENEHQNNRGFIATWFASVIPPPRWRVPVIFALGALIGLGGVVFYVSNAVSYLSDEPEACVNCHVMTPEYASWQRGSHGRVATCNDCHVPHTNPVATYLFKASDGMRHATIFTLRNEPQVITMHEAGQAVVQQNCIRCHQHQVGMTSAQFVTKHDAEHGEGKLCWDCHRHTPHGRVHSLASTPHARVPSLGLVTPDWMQDSLQQLHDRSKTLELE